MKHESYFKTTSECHYMLHSNLAAQRPSLLFIHGLGSSHIDFAAYLDSNLLDHFNILIPDLLGYGKSSMVINYDFHYQVDGLVEHLNYLQTVNDILLTDIVLIAHSMGGIHATMLCESSLKDKIKGFINVEGSITQYGSFIASSLVAALKNSNFNDWYEDFKQHKIYEKLARNDLALRSYFAGLEFCDPQAFLQNAIQMYQMSHALPGAYTHIMGKKYAELTLPTVYCYGDSLSKENIDFLNEFNLQSKHFTCSNHFLLSECLDEFVDFIKEYVEFVVINS